MQNQATSPFRFGPLTLDEVWDRVDPLAPDLGLDVTQAGLAGLPYSSLGWADFERLIYELLQAENQRPWFFGRTGQAQFGIDIVTGVAGKQNVYQCKNYGGIPSWPKVLEAIEKFESKWLNDMSLPPPEEFVYCCPQPLQSLSAKREALEVAFKKRTGVTLSFWDRDAIDSRLRKLPDLDY